MLFRAGFGACRDAAAFVEDFVHVDTGAARLLADVGVRTVGVDYLSVGAYEGDGGLVHRILIDAGIWIIGERGSTSTSSHQGPTTSSAYRSSFHGSDGAPAVRCSAPGADRAGRDAQRREGVAPC